MTIYEENQKFVRKMLRDDWGYHGTMGEKDFDLLAKDALIPLSLNKKNLLGHGLFLQTLKNDVVVLLFTKIDFKEPYLYVLSTFKNNYRKVIGESFYPQDPEIKNLRDIYIIIEDSILRDKGKAVHYICT